MNKIRRRHLLLFLAVGLFLLAMPPRPAAAGTAIAYPPPAPIFSPASEAKPGMLPAWEEFLAAFSQRNLQQIDASYNRLWQVKDQLGFANATEFSLALLALAARAQENHDATGAATLIRQAIRLSPDFSFPYQAQSCLCYDRHQYPASAAAWLRGLLAGGKNQRDRLEMIAALALLAALLPPWLLAFFLLAVLGRYFCALRDELEQRFSVTGTLLLSIGALALLAAMLWHSLFFLPAMAVLLLILSPMLDRRERLTGYAVIFLLFLTPMVYSTGMQLLQGLGDPFVNEALRINFDSFTPGELQAVWQPQTKKSRRPLQLFSQAVVHAHTGKIDQAINDLEKLIRLDDQAPAAVYNNLGNLYFHQNNLDLAIRQYKKAISRNPGSGIYHFNLNHAYIKKSFALAESESAFIQAWRLSPNLIKRQLAREQAGEGLTLINEPLPWSYTWQAITANRLDGGFLRAYCRRFAAPRFGLWFYYLALLFMTAAIAAAWIRQSPTSRFCPLCGTRFYGMRRLFVACPSCLHLSQQRHNSDMFAERQKRKIRIYHRLVDRSLLLGGFLVPGIFQVAIGNTVRGVFMLAGSFLLAAGVYCRSARIITRGIFPPGSPWATTVLPAALFLLLLAVNLLSWRQRKQQKTIVAGCF